MRTSKRFGSTSIPVVITDPRRRVWPEGHLNFWVLAQCEDPSIVMPLPCASQGTGRNQNSQSLIRNSRNMKSENVRIAEKISKVSANSYEMQ
jgi:hypothetical protein